jgi:multidrug efflux pump
VLSIVLIFLVLAAQFNSFRDPFIVLLGSVPLALFGAVIFMFLKMPFGTFFTNGWTTSLNIYSQVGLVTLVGLGLAKWHPDRAIRKRNAAQRHG